MGCGCWEDCVTLLLGLLQRTVLSHVCAQRCWCCELPPQWPLVAVAALGQGRLGRVRWLWVLLVRSRVHAPEASPGVSLVPAPAG